MAKSAVCGMAAAALAVTIVYGVLNLAALCCTDRYFHPQFYGLQFMAALYFLVGPILGLVAHKGLQENRQLWCIPQWHAMMSATNICLAIPALTLACYGTVIGWETMEYYKELNSEATKAYTMWIVAAPSLDIVCTVLILALSVLSFKATLTRDNAVKIVYRQETEVKQ